jgi:hypothetical protein
MLHYITLHFTDSMFVSKQVNLKQITDTCKATNTGFIKGHINMCKNIIWYKHN